MSNKSTKIIAALGVAAGLGVASLPAAGVFADYTAVNTQACYFYEIQAADLQAGGKFWDTDNSAVMTEYASNAAGDEVYYCEDDAYTAGKASADVRIEVEVRETLSLTVDANNVSTTMDAGSLDQSMLTVATVKTNHAAGYNLTVADKDDDTTLKHDNYASASTSAQPQYVFAAGNVLSGTAGWSISYINDEDNTYVAPDPANGVAGVIGTEAAMPVASGTAITLRTSNDATPEDGEAVKVTYNVRTLADQAAGHYSDIITYTATAKN